MPKSKNTFPLRLSGKTASTGIFCFVLAFSLCIPTWAFSVCDCPEEDLFAVMHSSCLHHCHNSSSEHHHHHTFGHDGNLCHPSTCHCEGCPIAAPDDSRISVSSEVKPLELNGFYGYGYLPSENGPNLKLVSDWHASLWASKPPSQQAMFCVWTK